MERGKPIEKQKQNKPNKKMEGYWMKLVVDHIESKPVGFLALKPGSNAQGSLLLQ